MKYVSYNNLSLYDENLKRLLGQTRDEMIQSKTADEWDNLSEFVPPVGMILIYLDHRSITDDNGNQLFIPDIKVGDGTRIPSQLSFISAVEALSISTDNVNKLNMAGIGSDGVIKMNTDVYIQGNSVTAQNFYGNASTADKLNHSLQIGHVNFDGSEDAYVPVYDGEMI